MNDTPDFGSRRDFYTFAPETLAQELPEFTIHREVGKGSMGIVYEATARATGKRVALKVLPPSLQLTERALARFLREGRIMASIHHPDIVGCFDQGTRGRLHWFAMDYVDGVTLQERLQIGPLPVRIACAICAQVARALQFAHDNGIVHRDIKPGNLMLRRDDGAPDGANGGNAPRVAITDFGLARETGTGSMTESGAIVGTPMYMAPELVLGGSAQASTLGDVYSLGATLYALVTGVPPFDGPTAQSVLKAVLEHDPRPPRRLRRDLPLAVEAIVLKAMERDPERRYGSAQEFAEDLERFLRGERVLARRPGPVGQLVRYCARRPLPTILAALVFVLLCGAFALMRDRNQRELLQSLTEAESWLAQASTTRDEQDRPRSAESREELLLAAIGAASEVIRRDPSFALAWFVRAKAHHRLRQFTEAIYDLDEAERLLGEPTSELLHFRIDTLQKLRDRRSSQRLQQDLARLLSIDPSPHTRALVAEHLLELAAQAEGSEQREALATARDVLQQVGDDDPRAAVTRARILETEGLGTAAATAMRAARERHPRDLYVRLQAAALFDRLGLYEEGKRERDVARLLGPEVVDVPGTAPLDLDGLGGFLGEVGRLMQVLDNRPAPDPQPAPATHDTPPKER